MLDWLKKPKKSKPIATIPDDLEGFLEIRDEGKLAVVDADKIPPNQRAEFQAGIVKLSGLEFFEGYKLRI